MIGIESNEKALNQFFEEGNIKYTIENKNDFKIYIVNMLKNIINSFFLLLNSLRVKINESNCI